MDIRLIEDGDGGDFVLKGNDIETIDGFQNMIYLGLFGGNLGANTKEFAESEQRSDWWGNNLFMQNDPVIQFNSNTERLLNNIALNSSSRLKIEESIKTDLSFMQSFGTLSVAVSIVSTDRADFLITFQEPNSFESNEFKYIWDSTQNELKAL